jgi:hypothetical protein
MDLSIQAICVDSVDPHDLATFWQEALGWRRTYAKDTEVVLEPPAGSPQDGVAPDLVFLRIPEHKIAKNRLHLDLRPADQAAEVTRLENLGARRVDVGQGSEVTWVVMVDPEGNEFCVLRAYTPEEIAAAAATAITTTTTAAAPADDATTEAAVAVEQATMDMIKKVEGTL